MKYGIIADVHSNLEAFWTILIKLLDAKIDKLLFCGDIVGYGGNPEECSNLLRFLVEKRNSAKITQLEKSLHDQDDNLSSGKKLKQLKKISCQVVAGNHDYAAVDLTDITLFNPSARQAVIWTRNTISDNNKKFLSAFPLVIKNQSFTVVHASPFNSDQWPYIFTMTEVEKSFDYFKTKLCFIGHSHVPFIASKNKYGRCQLLRKMKFRIQQDCRYLINVGSVGQPRDGNPKASYFLFDTDTGEISSHRLDYNISQAQKKILQHNLPKILADRLSWGQ